MYFCVLDFGVTVVDVSILICFGLAYTTGLARLAAGWSLFFAVVIDEGFVLVFRFRNLDWGGGDGDLISSCCTISGYVFS